MLENSILAKMERMLVENGIVTLDGDFVGKNMPAIDINGKDFWIMENSSGSLMKNWTNQRLRDRKFTVMYTIGVPIGSGTQIIDEKTQQICNLFKPNGENCNLQCEDCMAVVKEIDIRADYQNDTWYYRSIFLYINVSAHLS